MAARRNQHGLTANEERFAILYATQGLSKGKAYRQAYKTSKANDKSCFEQGCKVSKKLKVAERINELLENVRAESFVSHGKILRDLADDLESARSAENWTAVAALQDKLLKTQGLMRDRIAISDERAASDDDLVAFLARGDASKAAMIREIMGKPDEFDA